MRTSNLEENSGIPGGLLAFMALIAGMAIANLYYSQPLLEQIKSDICISEIQANLITVITQVGYALGLCLIIPLADLYSRRILIIANLLFSAIMALIIANSHSILVLWLASLIIGICSITPQFFMPVAGQFSAPQHKARDMGIVLGGLLTGVLSSRVISGFIGEHFGWRVMYDIAATLMFVCAGLSFIILPEMKRNFKGSYLGLMASVWAIVKEYPRIRVNSIRGFFAFGSMLAVWSTLAFHVASEPLNGGSDTVGVLALCGIAGILASGALGKYIPKYGTDFFFLIGGALQIVSWIIAYVFSETYLGLAAAIILLDVGLQFQQLSNQTSCFQELPTAVNRVNMIFMTTCFAGGALGTFFAGLGWKFFNWPGVCAVGVCFAVISVFVSLYAKRVFNGK